MIFQTQRQRGLRVRRFCCQRVFVLFMRSERHEQKNLSFRFHRDVVTCRRTREADQLEIGYARFYIIMGLLNYHRESLRGHSFCTLCFEAPPSCEFVMFLLLFGLSFIYASANDRTFKLVPFDRVWQFNLCSIQNIYRTMTGIYALVYFIHETADGKVEFVTRSRQN